MIILYSGHFVFYKLFSVSEKLSDKQTCELPFFLILPIYVDIIDSSS